MRRILLLSIAVFLSGCATVPVYLRDGRTVRQTQEESIIFGKVSFQEFGGLSSNLELNLFKMENRSIYKINIDERNIFQLLLPSDKSKSLYFFGNLPKGIYRAISLKMGEWITRISPMYVLIPNNGSIFYTGTIEVERTGKMNFWTQKAPASFRIIDEKEEGVNIFKNKFPQINAEDIKTALFHCELTEEEINAAVDGLTVGKTEYEKYYNKIRRKVFLYSEKNYAVEETGRVYLSFLVLNTGETKEIKIDEKKTKANQVLLEAAVNSVKSASPFPPFPGELSNNQELRFDIEIDYKSE